VENRDGLMEHLTAAGIGCAVYYPVPFHQQKCFAGLPSCADAFPVSDAVCSTIIALPVYPELTDEMIGEVVDCIVEFL
jgi:dTDP-4-amino-4,6-dideoxygalactose transaminase